MLHLFYRLPKKMLRCRRGARNNRSVMGDIFGAGRKKVWSVDGCVVFTRGFHRGKMLFERIQAGSWLLWQLLGLGSSHGCKFLVVWLGWAKEMKLGVGGARGRRRSSTCILHLSVASQFLDTSYIVTGYMYVCSYRFAVAKSTMANDSRYFDS